MVMLDEVHAQLSVPKEMSDAVARRLVEEFAAEVRRAAPTIEDALARVAGPFAVAVEVEH